MHQKPDQNQKRANRLVNEKSPYLLQHAWNPVDWYPWSEEAFRAARQENKPVFLSIGYATCHWCHVMEKESFEDPGVAGLLNENMVAIKVDREERPDLDHVYMAVCQMLTGSGGWPLTVVMTPDQQPFFAATYIPKQSRFGRPGMLELIPRIAETWKQHKHDLLQTADQIRLALLDNDLVLSPEEPDRKLLDQAYRDLHGRFDVAYGGFGKAPKFPSAHILFFLLRYWKRTGAPEALAMVEKTLWFMRRGGIYDQIGFGFHRYATDREWLVPHFEKMLYDQALLALAYLETFQAAGQVFYADTAGEILTYVLRDLTAPEGGFYSAEDADSEGEEGRYYLWSRDEIREVLPADEAETALTVFQTEPQGNFRREATGRRTGANILFLGQSLEESAKTLNRSPAEMEEKIASARSKLLAAREKRPRPLRDDKILLDWNGLMIAALARGAQVLNRPDYAAAAVKAAAFLLGAMRKPDGRLWHRYRDGEAAIDGHLDDYAFLVWGLLELYEATFDAGYLRASLELNGFMLKHFWDPEQGAFFFTPDDGESLLVRKKEFYDGALPSGNSMALLNLLRLARITGRPDLANRADGLARVFTAQARPYPAGYAQFLSALDFALGPSREIVIVGHSGNEKTAAIVKKIRSLFIPNKVVLFRPQDEEEPVLDQLAPFVKNHEMQKNQTTVYVCQEYACQKPVSDMDEIAAILR